MSRFVVSWSGSVEPVLARVKVRSNTEEGMMIGVYGCEGEAGEGVNTSISCEVGTCVRSRKLKPNRVRRDVEAIDKGS